jgi:hypothetical protein
MATLRHDFILHAVRQVATATAAIAAGRSARPYEQSLAHIRAACLDSLGMEFDVLTRFDATSVAGLFVSPEQMHVLVALVEEKAALLEAHGWEQEALREGAYAERLAEESRRRFRHRDVVAAGRLRHSLVQALLVRL